MNPYKPFIRFSNGRGVDKQWMKKGKHVVVALRAERPVCIRPPRCPLLPVLSRRVSLFHRLDHPL